MSHPTTIAGWSGSLAELAKAVAGLRYDALTDFVVYLATEVDRQAEADIKRNRGQLARKLTRAAQVLAVATEFLYDAWRIAKPYEEGTKES